VAARRGRRDRLAEDAREDLVQARDALLDELVALERAKIRGQVGPKTYERVRAAMLDALANVVAELDEDGVPSAAAPPPVEEEEAPPPPPRAATAKRRRSRVREARDAEEPR
jgi:hypothetical protein